MDRALQFGLGQSRLATVVRSGSGDALSIWDIQERAEVGRFHHGSLSFGSRASILEGKGPLVLLTRPHADGNNGFVAAVNGRGEDVWSRPDLPIGEARGVESGAGAWVTGTTAEGLVLLDGETGATVRTLKGVRRLSARDDGSAICIRDNSIQERALVKGPIVWTRSALVLAFGVSPTACAYSMGIRLVCVGREGITEWEWEFPDYTRVVTSVSWCVGLDAWVCAVQDRNFPLTVWLMEVSPNGEVRKETKVGRTKEIRLFDDGRHAVLAEGLVIDAARGATVWNLPDLAMTTAKPKPLVLQPHRHGPRTSRSRPRTPPEDNSAGLSIHVRACLWYAPFLGGSWAFEDNGSVISLMFKKSVIELLNGGIVGVVAHAHHQHEANPSRPVRPLLNP